MVGGKAFTVVCPDGGIDRAGTAIVQEGASCAQSPQGRGLHFGDAGIALRDAVVQAWQHFPHAADFEPVIKQLLAAQSPAAPPVDLGPILEKLSSSLQAMAERPATSIVPPGLSSRKVREMLPDEVDRQLSLLRDHLAPLAKAARASLQADTEGSVRAVNVWEQVNQALDLLKALGVRARK